MNGMRILDRIKEYFIENLQTMNFSIRNGGWFRTIYYNGKQHFENVDDIIPFKFELPRNIYSLLIFSDKTMYVNRSDDLNYSYNIEEFKRWLK